MAVTDKKLSPGKFTGLSMRHTLCMASKSQISEDEIAIKLGRCISNVVECNIEKIPEPLGSKLWINEFPEDIIKTKILACLAEDDLEQAIVFTSVLYARRSMDKYKNF